MAVGNEAAQKRVYLSISPRKRLTKTWCAERTNTRHLQCAVNLQNLQRTSHVNASLSSKQLQNGFGANNLHFPFFFFHPGIPQTFPQPSFNRQNVSYHATNTRTDPLGDTYSSQISLFCLFLSPAETGLLLILLFNMHYLHNQPKAFIS